MGISRIGQYRGTILFLLLAGKSGEPTFQMATCCLIVSPEICSLRSSMGIEHLSTQIPSKMDVHLPLGHRLDLQDSEQIQEA
jgi:hypothetical protein